MLNYEFCAENTTYLISGELYKSSRLIEFSPQTTLDDYNKKSFYQIQKAFLYVKTTPNIQDDENENNDGRENPISTAVLKIWIFQILEDEVSIIAPWYFY